jgi:L-rhamnose isomerase
MLEGLSLEVAACFLSHGVAHPGYLLAHTAREMRGEENIWQAIKFRRVGFYFETSMEAVN